MAMESEETSPPTTTTTATTTTTITRNGDDARPTSDSDQENHHHHHYTINNNTNDHDDDPRDRKRTWEESFALLQEYQKKHGHCRVPIRFDQDRRLGRWVYSQRTRRDKLTVDQVRRLQDLGFQYEDVDDADCADENDHDNNSHNNNNNNKGAKLTGPSHRELEEEEEEDDDDEDDEDDEMSPAPSSRVDDDDMDVGFTQTGRRRRAVKRYGITDNDDESDIARRRKEQLERQQLRKEAHRQQLQQQQKSRSLPTPTSSSSSKAKKVSPHAPPPLSVEEDDDDQEDPDYDSEEERRAREKRRKQRQQQQQQQQLQEQQQQQQQQEQQQHEEAAAASTNKRGRPKGRPRGRPRKETLQEKLEQIVVGSRVAVLWPAENEYYRATVTKVVKTRKRPYFLEYDDGETEWIDFSTGQTDFLVLTPRSGPRKRNRPTSSSGSKSNNNNNHHNHATTNDNGSVHDTPSRTASSTKTTTSSSGARANSSTRLSNSTTTTTNNNNNNSRTLIEVGTRVSVYWSDDEQYYEATVVKQRKDPNHSQPYKLEYEDGEYEWIDLQKVKFHFLDPADDSNVSPLRKSSRKRRVPSRMRDEDEVAQEDSSDDDDEDDDDDDEDNDNDNESDNYQEEIKNGKTTVTRTRGKVQDEDEKDLKHDQKKGPRSGDSTGNESSSDSVSLSASCSSSCADSDIELVSDVKQVHVGSRVAVYWSEEERYFEGTVTDHRKGHPRPFFMSYDDGDTQWLDLKNRNFCILKKVHRGKSRRRNQTRSRRRRSHSCSSSGSEMEPKRLVGGRFSAARSNHRRRPPPASSRPKCRSPTPTETSATTDDEREQRLASMKAPNPHKEIDLGTRVAVYCPRKEKFLDGTITHRQIPRNSLKKPCYYVAYDKGHSEWIELPKRTVRFLPAAHNVPTTKGQPAKRGRKKKPHDSPLLRMLREKEARKSNRSLVADDHEEETSKLEPIQEAESKLETNDDKSSTESDESEDATSNDEEISSESEVEIETPKQPLLADHIGIGTRLAVQCPKDLKFMEGTVTRLIRNRRKPFYVEYDIGGYEWIDVHSSTIKILTEEEEKLLKEQSAIVFKKDVEEALPEIKMNVCFVDNEDDADNNCDNNDNDGEAQAAPNEKESGIVVAENLVDSEMSNGFHEPGIHEPEQCRKVATTTRNISDGEVARAPEGKREVDDGHIFQSPGEDKHNVVGDFAVPLLRDEDSQQCLNDTINSIKEQLEKVLPESCDDKDSSAESVSMKNSVELSCAKIDLPGVSDSDGVSISDKDSPTAVACVLGSEHSDKIPKLIIDEVSLPKQKLSSESPDKSMDEGHTRVRATEQADTSPITAGATISSSTSCALARVAPVEIVSEATADGCDSFQDVINTSTNPGEPLNNTRKTEDTVHPKAARGVSSQVDVNEAVAQTVPPSNENLIDGDRPGVARFLTNSDASQDGSTEDLPSKPVPESGAEVMAEKSRSDNGTIAKIDDRIADISRNADAVKRKRGRPPKRNRPVPQPRDEEIESKAHTQTTPKTPPKETESIIEPPKKRGPGRPPKNQLARKESGDAISKKANLTSTSEQPDAITKKRGPGRPPKLTKPTKNGVEARTGEMDSSSDKAFQRRGSNRSPNTDFLEMDSDDEKTDTAEAEQPKKRGPGRPPKHTKPENAKNGIAAEFTPRSRGPGRPPKHPNPRRKSENDSLISGTKRGPGRPRKGENHEPLKKRGPGRPRKERVKDDDDDDDISLERNMFKVTRVDGSRRRKEPNRFSPTDFDDFDSDSDSSTDTDADKKTSGSTPMKISEFGAEHAEKAGQIEVGMRVSVYWGGDQEYYPGTVTKERSYRKKKFFLEYDDGESEWIDFRRNKFHILTPPKNGGKKRKAEKRNLSVEDGSILALPKNGGKKRKVGRRNSSDDDDASGRSSTRRRSSDSETDPSNLIRNRMEMAEVMLRIKIGCRVEVFWSEDDCYYPGTITKQRENIIQAKKPFFLEYDDGESEWIDLRDHVFRMIAGDGNNTSPDGISSSATDAVAANQGRRRKEREFDDVFLSKTQKKLKKK